MDNLQLISDCFGANWSQPDLFYKYDFALRFEIGAGEGWVERCPSAVQRAESILDSVLTSSSDLVLGIIRWDEQDESSLAAFDEALDDYGLPSRDSFVSGLCDTDGHRDAPEKWEYVAKLPRVHLSRALWAAVVNDFGSLPRPPGSIYIASFEYGLLFHPYDDRGLDVISTEPRGLQVLYDTYNDWLIDYEADQKKMMNVFASTTKR